MIELKNVTKKYGNLVAVDNISFDVKDGEIIGLLGQNGAGKSTTMNMITGFIEPTEGDIIINGYDISKKAKKAKKQIGYMPENVPLYTELSVKEFVSYMAELKLINKKERKEAVQKALENTGLIEVQNRIIRNLSRGYKQRVSMAGALVGDPEILILDEPTVGLDPKQVVEIRNLIKKLKEKHTVIISSHILSEISQICDRVVIINKGKLIAIDTPASLEEKTKEQNVILLTVEDKQNRMENIKEKIEEIKEISMVKDNEDGTKQYKIVSQSEIDLRKKLFEVLPKEEITIFELKKSESTLEEAFIKLVDTTKQENVEKESIKQEKVISKEEKKALKREEKKAKKEEKALKKEKNKKAEKEDKK